MKLYDISECFDEIDEIFVAKDVKIFADFWHQRNEYKFLVQARPPGPPKLLTDESSSFFCLTLNPSIKIKDWNHISLLYKFRELSNKVITI